MSIKLIVWYVSEKSRRTITVTNDPITGGVLTHQAANRLARGMYDGMKTKVVTEYREAAPFRSYCDKMAGMI